MKRDWLVELMQGAKRVVAPDSFKPSNIHSYLAQLAEHLTVNQVVAGSSPAVGAIKEPHELSSCGFFYYFCCYGENLLTQVIAATDEVIVPKREFEP